MFTTDFALNDFTLIIAQDDGGPSLRGSGNNTGTASGNDTTGADGGAGGGAPPPNPFGGNMLLIFGGIFFFIILWSILGQRKEKKKREAMLDAIGKHDRVQTIGGVIGSVVELKSDTVVLKVDESSNTRMTFSRSAIQQVLSENPSRKREDPADAE